MNDSGLLVIGMFVFSLMFIGFFLTIKEFAKISKKDNDQ